MFLWWRFIFNAQENQETLNHLHNERHKFKITFSMSNYKICFFILENKKIYITNIFAHNVNVNVQAKVFKKLNIDGHKFYFVT